MSGSWPASFFRDRSGWLLAAIILVACFRLSHIHLLWADEDYHLAAAINLLHGKAPYRDFWYDKPPLTAAYYLLIGGQWGWPLRMLDAAYILLACRLAFLLGLQWWGRKEGYLASFLLAFFTTFYLPSAVIPFAADATMLVPHLGAIYCASGSRSWQAGLWIGLAFLANTKALFVLLTCSLWLWPAILSLLCGFALPILAALAVALPSHILAPYWEQVWHWGALYAKGSPVAHPLSNGLLRTANWMGFHCFLAIGAAYALARSSRSEQWKLGVWIALSFAATALGSRFAPHYFLQLLPSFALCGARGAVLLYDRFRSRAALAGSILLAIPLLRFGPHYGSLAATEMRGRNPRWSDVVMDLDSQNAAALIRPLAHQGDTLFVWGYRPDMYVYTRMVSDSRFWDSQPLTGVPADRHLGATQSIYDTEAAPNRRELAFSRPSFIVDGLSTFNPRLSPDHYPELRPWLAHYKLVRRTALTLIYQRMNEN